ncbi:hypothetical protein [Agromyces aureus]|uniref:Uncharacterized protein n=1 Tax=Agromyces aureus TaxID=453304 RepID=A0A191WEZ5_9MICO|nr:hypothetical protein [Agromyces aureus]ANJ26797.1 hypothetical protein ATC03_08790 [Agromyces aureus]
MTQRIWYNADVDYIGAVGISSVREMAELAVKEPDITDALGLHEVEDPTVEQVEEVLNELNIEASRVPAAVLHNERWDGVIATIPLDAKPGSGYVKVLGTNL